MILLGEGKLDVQTSKDARDELSAHSGLLGTTDRESLRSPDIAEDYF